ncbi:MAG: acyl transferase [Gilvibacter sp.]
MLQDDIFKITTDQEFEKVALQVFGYQHEHCAPYKEFCDYLAKSPANVKQLKDIPFLPIELFRTHRVLSDQKTAATVFGSSGTTASATSKHHVASLEVYQQSFIKGFEAVYGAIEHLVVIGLLPSYLERNDSSLVYMVDRLIAMSGRSMSGFYLDDYVGLNKTLERLELAKQPFVLFGVTFALLDFIKDFPQQLRYGAVIETGGMKGMRKEMIRSELHEVLSKGFGLQTIHSEYGMTELLSQAYATAHGIFHCPPWMRVFTRELNDPLQLIEGKTGGISIIDLANLYSCSFIATQDLGKKISSHSFEILGRFDHSDLRGCNLMVL